MTQVEYFCSAWLGTSSLVERLSPGDESILPQMLFGWTLGRDLAYTEALGLCGNAEQPLRLKVLRDALHPLTLIIVAQYFTPGYARTPSAYTTIATTSA